MYNAKHVKEALAKTLKAVREAIGLDGDEPALKKNKKTPEEHPEKATSKKSPAHRRSSSFSISGEESFDELAEAFEESDSPFEDETGNGVRSEAEVEGDSDFDSETYAAFDARIASSSDDEEGEEREDLLLRGDTISQLQNELLASVAEDSLPGTHQMDPAPTKEQAKERPARSVEVAKRLIHGHLGVKLPRARDSKSNTPGEEITITDRDAAVSLLEVVVPTAEEHTLTSESEELPSAPKSTKLNKAKPQSGEPRPENHEQRETAKRRERQPSKAETGDSEEPKRLRTMATKASTSTFVPSLNMVGYWSGSESEASDIEEHVAPRKNRRGQRARQKIWEQKFGGSAKHLGDEAKAKQKGRDDGWDLQRGATGKSDDGWKKGKGATWKGKDYNGENAGANAIPVAVVKRGTGVPLKKNKGKDDAGPLHPSWEAKKVAKSKISMVPFEGKKITFD
jgi:hypothetical protein